MGNSWSFFCHFFQSISETGESMQIATVTYGKEFNFLFIKSAEIAKLDPQSGVLFVVGVMK